MVRKCIVENCASTLRTQGVSLHRLPSGAQKENLRQKWVSLCRISGTLNSSTSVCSKHFASADYFDSNRRQKLKPCAFPSLNLPDFAGKTTHSLTLTIDPTLQNQTYLVKLQDTETYLKIQIQYAANGSTVLFAEKIQNRREECVSIDESPTINTVGHAHPSVQLRQKLSRARRIGKSVRLARNAWRNSYKELLKSCRNNTSANMIRRKVQAAQENIHKYYRTGLCRIFSITQIKKLLSKKRCNWTSNDIASAIAIKYKSNTYEELLKRNFPLPSVSTLHRWTRNITFQPGLLSHVLDMMKSFFQQAKPLERQAVLCFDEIGIDSRYCYDSEEDKVLGGKNNMQVFLVRGLFYPWKQVVAYDFEEKLTAIRFRDMIGCLEMCGLEIRVVVCDMGGKNCSLWNALGVKVSQSSSGMVVTNSIKSPVHNNNIYFMADQPHEIKSLRNNFLDYGLSLPEGGRITKDDLSYLLRVDSNELKLCWKLTQKHLEVKGKDRMRVGCATELWSSATAEVWKFGYPSRKEEAEFILAVNNFFDVVNSRHLHETNPFKKPYGLAFGVQDAALEKMDYLMRSIRVTGHQKLFQFQKGYIISIKSFRELYKELSDGPLKIKYILGHRLNQDIIENLFSQLRGMGGFVRNPTALEAKRRLKLTTLSHSKTLVSGTSVEHDGSDDFLSAKLLAKLNSSNKETVIDPVVLSDSPSDFSEEDDAEEVGNFFKLSEKCRETALTYLAGFVAFKLQTKNPELFVQKNPEMNTFQLSMAEMKIKNVVTPSITWIEQVFALNKEFEKFHGYNFFETRGILKGFVKALQQKYKDINRDALSLFIKTRFFIRIKYANRKLAEKYKTIRDSFDDRQEKLQKHLNLAQNHKAFSDYNCEREIESRLNLSSIYQGSCFSWSEKLEKIVTSQLKFISFKNIQETAINSLLCGMDTLVVMPTGGGKSAIFQAAGVLQERIVCVFSPLTALIVDQANSLRSLGLNALALSAEEDTDLERLSAFLSGEETKFIFLTPEKYRRSKMVAQELLKANKNKLIGLFVIDEVHCILDWGREFREDFMHLSSLKTSFKDIPILGLTATASSSSISEISSILNLKDPVVLLDTASHENLYYSVKPLLGQEKNDYLIQKIRGDFLNQCGIVYCMTVREVDTIRKLLNANGIKATQYHSKMKASAKNRAQMQWFDGSFDVMVATSSFGMGINKLNCSFVIHYSLPLSITSYLQQTGRAGRNGLEGNCILLLNLSDVFRAIEMVALSQTGVSDLMDLLGYCIPKNQCRKSLLKAYYSEPHNADEICFSCDNCDTAREKLNFDYKKYLMEIIRIIDLVNERNTKITACQILDICFGRTRKGISRQIEAPDKSRLELELVMMECLVKKYVKESIEVAQHKNICYIMRGFRAHFLNDYENLCMLV